MKNEILLQKLNNIKDVEGNGNYLLETLIKDIENEIRLEEMPKTTTAGRNKFCMNFAKKIRNETLKYTHNEDGFQYFSDSYFLVALKEEDKLPIDECPERLNYPRITNLVNKKNLYKVTLKTKDILNELKINDFYSFTYSEDKTCLLEKKVFEAFLKFLNYNEDEITLQLNSATTPVYVEKSNGSFGIVLPLRRG